MTGSSDKTIKWIKICSNPNIYFAVEMNYSLIQLNQVNGKCVQNDNTNPLFGYKNN